MRVPVDRAASTVLSKTGGLGRIVVFHPPGSFAPTPATRVAVEAIGRHRRLLAGVGIDWGSGSGCLAIAAARIESVEHVIGLDILEDNVRAARENARSNRAHTATTFLTADSFRPLDPGDGQVLDEERGRVGFILANPPASSGDDGFGFRRAVVAGSAEWLRSGGVILLSVSSQYGAERVAALQDLAPGMRHRGVLESSAAVPFDLDRPDLVENLRDYVEEERRGGIPYAFELPDGGRETATSAWGRHRAGGTGPLTRWQVHLFERVR